MIVRPIMLIVAVLTPGHGFESLIFIIAITLFFE
jgi:hypothetical protein